MASKTLIQTNRERAFIFLGALLALALGAFAALGTPAWLTTLGITLIIVACGLTLPISFAGLLLAALIPFQFYFFAGDTAFSLRAALILAFVLAFRLFATRFAFEKFKWLLPALAFLVAAFIAAIGADSRYLALRGMYDWLAVFATAFFFSAIIIPRGWISKLAVIVIGGGTLQAVVGLMQAFSGRDAALEMLRQPASAIFFQPNLLKEKLADLSFNWLTFERVSPFGTFINGIDYAVFLAAILCFALAFLFTRRARLELIGCAAGIGALALLSAPRFSIRLVPLALALSFSALMLALPFADVIAERVAFLIQREQGAFGTLGRLDIWLGLFTNFLQRPWFGYGLNHATLLTPPGKTLSGGAIAFYTVAPESAYVAALVETGAVGFIALIFFLTNALTRAFKIARAQSNAARIGICAALVALLVGNLTITGLTTDQNGMLFGMFVGLVFAEWRA
ncbi:MAG: O-antigen ligase family protein [Chloroflexi bacterium]|nr:O-antigen ligase family protein [Chloroflexota bacterium]